MGLPAMVIVLALIGLVGFSETMRINPIESDQSEGYKPGSLYWKKLFSTTWSEVSSNRTGLGDVTKLKPTGKFDTGVPGSRLDVRLDLYELQKRWTFYQEVADKNSIQASVIAALASRESRGGRVLYDTFGFGDHGRAYGILQCDLKHSGLGLGCVICFWDSLCHVDMMVSKILVPYIHAIRLKFPSWTSDMCLQGGVAAYNEGVGNVESWSNLDKGTTHNDYSNDVIARAQYLYTLGWN